jgi:ankyrin repeat protein
MKHYVHLIRRKNRQQRTALHEAARLGNIDMLDLCFRIISTHYDSYRYAWCQDVDDEFKTCLHLAAAAGHHHAVQFLLDRGAHVCSFDMNDSTPLHEASSHGRYDCVEILLDYRAPIDQYDGSSNTPLHRASKNGHWTIVRLLLARHANVCLSNCDGYNSLEMAIVNNQCSTVDEFLRDQTWMMSLRHAQRSLPTDIDNNFHNAISTPLRKLIRHMPKKAKDVFTKCTKNIGFPDDDSFRIIYNYELLEDQISIRKWQQSKYL